MTPGSNGRGLRAARGGRWAVVLLAAAIAGCFGFFAYKMYKRTTGAGKEGDFRYFYNAAAAVSRGEDPYSAGERVGEKNGYIYPPLFAVGASPLGSLERRAAERVWAGINAGVVAITLVVGFRVMARRLGTPTDAVTMLACVLLALLLTVEQARWVIEQGQTDPLVLLGFTLALAWMDRRPVAAGGALGFVANIKYQSLIALPYFVVRGRWRAAVSTLVSTAAIALLPALVVGWEKNLEYLGVAMGSLGKVLGLASPERNLNIHDMTWINSVSIPSAVARHMDGSSGAAIAAVAGVIAAGTLAAAWGVYRARGVPLFRGRWGAGEREGVIPGVVALEWCGLIVALLAFSPQAMVRHGYLLLLVHLAAALIVLCPRPGVKAWPLIAGLVVEQLGTKLPPGDDRFQAALDGWRSVGGSSWCYLVMFLTLLWTGLAWLTAGPRKSSGPGRITPGGADA